MTNDIGFVKVTLVQHHHYYTIIQVHEFYISLYIPVYLQDLKMLMDIM